MSAAVERLVELAQQLGLESVRDQWSEALVYWFAEPMPDEVLAAGEIEPTLAFFGAAKTPHLPAHQGFIDRAEKVALTFEKNSS